MTSSSSSRTENVVLDVDNLGQRPHGHRRPRPRCPGLSFRFRFHYWRIGLGWLWQRHVRTNSHSFRICAHSSHPQPPNPLCSQTPSAPKTPPQPCPNPQTPFAPNFYLRHSSDTLLQFKYYYSSTFFTSNQISMTGDFGTSEHESSPKTWKRNIFRDLWQCQLRNCWTFLGNSNSRYVSPLVRIEPRSLVALQYGCIINMLFLLLLLVISIIIWFCY